MYESSLSSRPKETERGRGEFLGVWRLVGDLGAAVGPFVMGSVVQWASLAVACTGTGAMALVGVVLLVASVPETLHRRGTMERASESRKESRQ